MPALREVGRELAAGQRDVGEVLGQRADVVVLAVEEGEPARLRLVHDVDLDAPHDRQPLALEARVDGAARLVGAGVAVEDLLAVAGVGLEHQARAAHPLRDAVGAGAHGMVGDVLAVALDHLAGQRRGGGHREHVGEGVVGVREPDADRVAVERLQALDGAVVVEAPGLLRRLHGRVRPADLALDEEEPLAPQLRVEEALDGIDVVVRRELARLAAERGIGREEDAGPDLQREGGAVVGHLGQRRPCCRRASRAARGSRRRGAGRRSRARCCPRPRPTRRRGRASIPRWGRRCARPCAGRAARGRAAARARARKAAARRATAGEAVSAACAAAPPRLPRACASLLGRRGVVHRDAPAGVGEHVDVGRVHELRRAIPSRAR